jgi:hypothetical protein
MLTLLGWLCLVRHCVLLSILLTLNDFFFICAVGFWVLRPLLAYCTSPGWYVRVIVEKLVEWRFAGETEMLGENLRQRHFVRHKSTWRDPGLNPGRRGGKPATNRLSYGAAPLNDLGLLFQFKLISESMHFFKRLVELLCWWMGLLQDLYLPKTTQMLKQEVLWKPTAFFPSTVIWVSVARNRKKTLVYMRNEVNKRIQFGRIQCWYYWWEWFMKYTIEMTTDGVIYVPSFMKIYSAFS